MFEPCFEQYLICIGIQFEKLRRRQSPTPCDLASFCEWLVTNEMSKTIIHI